MATPPRTAASAKASAPKQLAGFMAKFSPSIAKEGRAALTRMRRLVPGAVQMVYDNWNGLVIGFGPTERASEAIVSILMVSDHVTLCFIQNGPDLPDPTHLLKGSGNVVRHVRLTSARDLDTPPIRALVKAAVKQADVPFNPRQRGRLVIKSISKRQRPRRPALQPRVMPYPRSSRERATASEPRERSAPAKRRARERVGESEGRSPSGKK